VPGHERYAGPKAVTILRISGKNASESMRFIQLCYRKIKRGYMLHGGLIMGSLRPQIRLNGDGMQREAMARST